MRISNRDYSEPGTMLSCIGGPRARTHRKWPTNTWSGKVVESPIAAITIGPSPRPERVKFATGETVLRRGPPSLDIRSTKVPLRNW
jgi:hypothetical protein